MEYSEVTGGLVVLWCVIALLHIVNIWEEGISLLLLSATASAVTCIILLLLVSKLYKEKGE